MHHFPIEKACFSSENKISPERGQFSCHQQNEQGSPTAGRCCSPKIQQDTEEDRQAGGNAAALRGTSGF